MRLRRRRALAAPALALALALPTRWCCAGSAAAGQAGVYVQPQEFIRATFAGNPPPPETLWPSPGLQERMAAVLGHPYKQLRIRYWRQQQRTAWVLDEVGKEEEITIGFVLAADAIERTEVLAFRESRGWEIRFESFTRQFAGVRLGDADKLDKRIDGITGATLSVGAYHRLARMALLLHQEVLGHAR